MSQPALTLESVDDRTLPDVEEVLERNGLPSAAVRSATEWFFAADDGDRRIGIGGIEPTDTDGLLRSVVVERSVRGDGYGTALCAALERKARAAGIDTLYLLTTTAATFFADRGYVEIERREAPAGIRETREFDELCPATATCMRRSL